MALAAVDNRLPHEIALDDLTRIGQLGLPEQNRFKEHYTLVSDTIRIYIERTQGVPNAGTDNRGDPQRAAQQLFNGSQHTAVNRTFLKKATW